MPGIVGLITRMPREQAVAKLAKMVTSICHESFYSKGTWIDVPTGIYLGWVARKGSFADNMPLRNEKGDVVLSFAGEEFPEPGIAGRLKESGHDLKLSGPSYLVHEYEEDSAFPANLNGRFHGLVVDRRRNIGMLFNDRFGMNRLYYHQSEGTFYFAAEAKAILAVQPGLRRFDSRSLGEFVSTGTVLEDRTVFSEINVLPPASAWTFRNGELTHKSTYFQPKEWEEQDPLDPEQYYKELRTTFIRNLPRYFVNEEKIGMSLTGGLDTRMILASQPPEPYSLPCYTFGSMFRDNHDVRVARQVAKACQQTHEVLTAGQEFLSQFPRYAERAIYLTDGCVDVSRAADLYLNQRVREIAPVRMTGNYGGEILRGVRSIKHVEPSPGLFSRDTEPEIQRAGKTCGEVLYTNPVSVAAFQGARWGLYGVLALEQTQLSMRSPYLDNDFVRTVFRAPSSTLANNEVSLRLVADGNPALSRIPTDRGLAGNHGPIFATASRGLLEFQFKAEYAYDMGMPQWLARIDHLISPLHPELVFLGRHKPFHYRVWYRDALADYVREILLDSRSLSRPYVERRGLEAIVQGHLDGGRNYTTELHKVLTLELMSRLFMDNVEKVHPNLEPEPSLHC
jgi:asparagine synthase (glutamine-hydrolysing)